MNFKKTVLQAALVAVVGATGMAAHATAVNFGDVLTINAGVPLLNASYVQIDVSSGSYFAMDNNGNSNVAGAEKVVLGQGSTGLVIGVTTAAGASHRGVPTAGDSNAIDAPWAFFRNTGSDFVTVPVTGDTTTGLDLSGWTVTWNSIPAIPMGAGSWNPGNCAALGCNAAAMSEGTAEFIWNGVYGSSYVINYTATVPVGDVSGFGGVQYFLHLEGVVNACVTDCGTPAVPVPAAVWLFGSGLLGLVGVARRRKAA